MTQLFLGGVVPEAEHVIEIRARQTAARRDKRRRRKLHRAIAR